MSLLAGWHKLFRLLMRLIELNKRARGIFEWTSIRKHLHNALILLIEYRVHGLHFEYYIFYLMLGEIRLQYEPEQRAQSTFKVWVNLGVLVWNYNKSIFKEIL